MLIVFSSDGSSTITGWNRRASAPSFSMLLRYSSSVVAPTHEMSPRASAGFKMLEPSMLPPIAPAPTSVCSSSMNRMTLPLLSFTSFRTPFRRSSKDPRKLAPATIAARSSEITRLSFMLSGTSPATIRCAMPSTMAVLPTPGSPISAGLFFVRRHRTSNVRRISSSRPMTGSSLPFFASSVRSIPYFSKFLPFGTLSGLVHEYWGIWGLSSSKRDFDV